ncbi:MAG: hypothetical protein M0T84_16750 [Betaproteobacteria bacterium]|nr:hypothetical protein [Betaproteobacteria bacterium]
MMKQLLVWIAVMVWAPAAFALSPYVVANKVAPGSVRSVMAQVEAKLTHAGFRVVGRYTPVGLPQYGTVVVTDQGILNAISAMGGATIVGAGLRVGVQSDGTVTYENPDYWLRAYFRRQFPTAQAAVAAASNSLARALGRVRDFGGNVSASDLPDYRYMIGMERFDDDKDQLKTYPSFAAAVAAVNANLAKGVDHVSKVYEVSLPARSIAVFGVAMNGARSSGEAWWIKKIGADHIAALPWEIYVVGPRVYALYGRYRIALAWPSLGMGTFMEISSAPDDVLETLTAVAGGVYEKSSAF